MITKITVTLEDGTETVIFPVAPVEVPAPVAEEPVKVIVEDAIGTETVFVPEVSPETAA